MIHLLLTILLVVVGVTAQIEEGKGFSVVCHELYVTGVWQKDVLGGDVRSITLLDTSCNNFESNQTHVWITANFDRCGSTSSQTNLLITQENEASLTMANVEKIVERPKTYRYSMRCVFARGLHVSSNIIESNTTVKEVVKYNVTLTTKYNVSMDVYTSNSFLIPANRPIVVTSKQPIYLGIKAGSNSGEAVKFIINKCEALVTGDRPHTFLETKCPLDRSLEIYRQDGSQFNFHVEAFPLIQARESAYVKCNLYVCSAASTSAACTQQCKADQTENTEAPLAEMTVNTETITYQYIKTCADTVCRPNSECKELYPAVCVCFDGYIHDLTTDNCTLPAQDKTLFVTGLSLDINFVESYQNTSSDDFIRLAAEAERLLMAFFASQGLTNIIGAKVLTMRSGSVLLDVQLIYAQNATAVEVKESFTKLITSNATQTSNVTKGTILQIQPNVVPTVTEERIDPTVYIDDTNTLLYAIVFTVAGVILIALGVSWAVRNNKRMSMKTEKYTVNEPPSGAPEKYTY